RTINLVEQGTDLRAVIEIVRGQCRRYDLTAIGIHSDVQFPQVRRVLVPCFSTSHSPAPHSFNPVLSTSRCTGSAAAPPRERNRGTSSVFARRLSVEWSRTARVRPRSLMIEPISPSVWRRASRNTALSVSAVRIASGEYQACPPRVVRGAAFQPSIAASLNQTVRLARCPTLASYAAQLVTLRFCFGMWWRRAPLALNGMGRLGSEQGPAS